MDGVAGVVLVVIANVCEDEVPQALVAVTRMFPLFAFVVVEILVVVELPDQPLGNVQL